jgi:hypothetical protein
MTSNEIKLWQTMRRLTESVSSVADIVIELNIPVEEAEAILENWTEKGLYTHGPDIFSGWITDRYQARKKA